VSRQGCGQRCPGAGPAAGTGPAALAGWADGGSAPSCHPVPRQGASSDAHLGRRGCAVRLPLCCCCHAGPWELGEVWASRRRLVPGEPLSHPRGAGGHPSRSQTATSPQVPGVWRWGSGTHPGTHSPGTLCEEQQNMLKFNASANGLSGEEQKPRQIGLLSHGREKASVPSPREPLIAAGFTAPSTPCFLEEGETSWCLAEGTPLSLTAPSWTKAHQLPPSAAEAQDRATSHESTWIPVDGPQELMGGDGPLRVRPCPQEPELHRPPPPPPEPLPVPSRKRGRLRTGRGAEGQVGTSCCIAWVVF